MLKVFCGSWACMQEGTVVRVGGGGRCDKMFRAFSVRKDLLKRVPVAFDILTFWHFPKFKHISKFAESRGYVQMLKFCLGENTCWKEPPGLLTFQYFPCFQPIFFRDASQGKCFSLSSMFSFMLSCCMYVIMLPAWMHLRFWFYVLLQKHASLWVFLQIFCLHHRSAWHAPPVCMPSFEQGSLERSWKEFVQWSLECKDPPSPKMHPELHHKSPSKAQNQRTYENHTKITQSRAFLVFLVFGFWRGICGARRVHFGVRTGFGILYGGYIIIATS